MKTYQTNTNEKKRNFFVRHKHVFIAIGVLAVIAAVVVLSVVLTLPKSEPVTGKPEDPPGEVVTPEIKTVMPMSNAAYGLEYANDKLVYWETLEIWRTHPAMDFVGSGDVLCVRDGTVTDVEMHTTLDGNVVTVTHDDGYVTIYKSLGDDVAVKVGDKVSAGDKLGTAGNTMMSELKTGNHLHLEVKKNGKHVDPATILPVNEDK
ncbi:MAG: M23 family metallopeptidase [Clostridiales bacterium]|nr:M23 family metallopeptidase [Clostridiales bacterium]